MPLAPRPALAAGALALTALLAAACGHGQITAPPASSTSSSTPTPTPTPTKAPVLRSPLTGLPVAALRPVIAVKIDNVGTYGQNGLNAADVVYCEEVEGGLTRLLAVFSSTPPTSAGPVRSARESDLELLGEYGKVGLAFSGANTGVVAEVNAANVRNDSYDDQTSAYSMDEQRPAPYRFLVDVATLVARAPGVLAHDVGFRFGAAPAAAVVPATGTAAAPGRTFTVTYPGARMSGSLSGASYVIARNGTGLSSDDAPVTATNVLLQYVTVRSSRFTDHNHNPTPYSETIGSGRALLLRAGREYTGTWSRTSQTGPTTWTATGGGSLTLAAGRTWVLLVPLGAPVAVG
jgi:hypothetical protein